MKITGNIKSMHACVYVSLGWAKGKLEWGGGEKMRSLNDQVDSI